MAGKEVSYILILDVVLTASGVGALSYLSPANEQLSIEGMRFSSTGIFNITDIQTSGGLHLTNASPAHPIPSSHFQNGASANIGYQNFTHPVFLDMMQSLTINVTDTSVAGNTVRFSFMCTRILSY